MKSRKDSWKINGPKGAGLLLIIWLGLSAAQGIHSLPAEVPDSKPTEPQSSPPRSVASEEEILIAIVDTGVDVTHPALSQYIWKNLGESGQDMYGREKAINGVDDDENGYIDDVHGFDFTTHRGAVEDINGHGTHIAGIIADRLKDQEAQNVKFMILTYYREGIDGPTALQNSIECVRYAIKMGAKVINYSGGGPIPSPKEREVFLEAEEQGILVVAAAGNESRNSENSPFYPANYGFSNILSVTAVDGESLRLLPSSNFGIRSVHVAANGKDIRSTLPGGHYGMMTGTSQATAIVTGQAVRAIVQSQVMPSPEMVMEILMASSNPSRGLAGKTQEGTVLMDRDLDWLEANTAELSSSIGEALRSALSEEEKRGLVVKSGLAPR